MLKITHNGGFFSCCSVKLHDITRYFNKNKMLPDIVDGSEQFELYKKDSTEWRTTTNHEGREYSVVLKKAEVIQDITFDYFQEYNTVNETIVYEKDIDYEGLYQFENYKRLDYKAICPFVRKYFSPSNEIKSIIEAMETKYNLQDYSNLCVLFYRGNDKVTEAGVSNYTDTIEKAKEVLSQNPSIQFLIQSDETEFIETMLREFPSNSFYFKEEARHIRRQLSSVDYKFRESNYIFSKFFLAITIIMSKCKYVVCGGSGNCSIWIMLYRENANNVYQFMNTHWV